MALKWKLFLVLISVFVYSCKEKYIPAVVDAKVNYLVVEGFINTGEDSTIITLSRTINLNGKAVAAPEKGATVSVENSGSQSVTLPEIKAGSYAIPKLTINKTGQFRIKIRTATGREYVSDFVDSKVSPVLDSITYDFRNSSLNLQVNSKDPTGNSQYYLYSFVETYLYEAAFHSFFKLENRQILERKFPQEDVYRCWRTAPSTTVNLMTTTALSQDRLDHVVLIRIPSNSQKISVDYSVLVKQHVLTRQGFDFWSALRKNTEQIGTIFDSQPSLLNGNIHSVTNPGEYVIGFISAGTTSQKRIFVTKEQLPKDWRFTYTGCKLDTLSTGEITQPQDPVFYPIDQYVKDGVPKGWFASDYVPCFDCRTSGGTTTKPSFWH